MRASRRMSVILPLHNRDSVRPNLSPTAADFQFGRVGLTWDFARPCQTGPAEEADGVASSE